MARQSAFHSALLPLLGLGAAARILRHGHGLVAHLVEDGVEVLLVAAVAGHELLLAPPAVLVDDAAVGARVAVLDVVQLHQHVRGPHLNRRGHPVNATES